MCQVKLHHAIFAYLGLPEFPICGILKGFLELLERSVAFFFPFLVVCFEAPGCIPPLSVGAMAAHYLTVPASREDALHTLRGATEWSAEDCERFVSRLPGVSHSCPLFSLWMNG